MSAHPQAPGAGPEATYGDELPAGTVLLRGQYTIERFLNSGGFGITYLARDSLDRRVVIKECFPQTMCRRADKLVRVRSRSHQKEFDSIVRLFGAEARALAKMEHPNIVGVHQVFEDNETSYMALDFVRGKDLLDIIEEEPGRLGPRDIEEMLKKMLSAVAYIHDRGILHRDISPDNILVDEYNNPVLIDFGAAREEATRHSRVLSAQHTVKDGYSPQEFYISGSPQTLSSDLYALAATFYHLITGSAPPVSQKRLAAVADNERDPYMPLLGFRKDYDQYFLSAIDHALEVFPRDRLQTAHEWLDEIDRERRRKVNIARARRDEQMEMAISALVQETNKVVTGGEEDVSNAAVPNAQVSHPAPEAAPAKASDAFPRLNNQTYLIDPSSGDPKHSEKPSLLERVFGSPFSRRKTKTNEQSDTVGKADQ